MEEIKDVWDLDVTRKSRVRVVFSQLLTRREAVQHFNNNDYEDIIDEEDYEIEA